MGNYDGQEVNAIYINKSKQVILDLSVIMENENAELQAELDKVRKGNIDIIFKLNAEIEKEHDAVEYWMKEEKGLKAEIKGLQVENIKLNAEKFDNTELIAEIEELKAEISQLKADIRHDSKVCEDYDDGLLAEIKKLKADNISLFKRLNDANKGILKGILREKEHERSD